MTATSAAPASNAIVNPADERPLSPWWLRAIVIVMVIGFTVLIAITALAYRNAPPIPHIVVDPQGKPLFTDADIGEGQAVFLKYGLMDNGSIWGHGAYLGPDYSAEALHWMGQDTAAALAQTQFDKPLAAAGPDAARRAASRSCAGAENQSLRSRQRRTDADCSGSAGLAAADRLLDRLLQASRQQRGVETEPDQRPGRAASVHRVRDMGGMGLRGESARRESFLHQQLSLRSQRWQYTDPRRASVERIELAGVAGRYRRGPPGIWKVRLSGLDQSRPCDPPLRAARRSQSRSTRAGQVLCPRRAGVSVPDPGGRRRRALSRRSRQFLRLPTREHLSEQSDAYLASAERHHVDRHLVRGRCAVSWSHPAPRRAARSCDVDAPAVRRVRRGDRRQFARRMGGHLATAWPLVVLDRQPGLGIPGARPHLAIPAGDRPAGLVCAALVGGASQQGGKRRSAADRTDVFRRRSGDPGVLRPGAVLRREDQLHRGRHLALLDHPSVGRGLLRVLRHDDSGAGPLPARSDPPQHGAAGDLSGCDPVLPRRTDRHRPSLVFHGPDRLQHGDVGAVFRAGSGAA